jgi:phosphatidylinositol-bisphosphatase
MANSSSMAQNLPTPLNATHENSTDLPNPLNPTDECPTELSAKERRAPAPLNSIEESDIESRRIAGLRQTAPRDLEARSKESDALLANATASTAKTDKRRDHRLSSGASAKVGECYRWETAALPRIDPGPRQSLRVFCGVWNLHGKKAPADLAKWLIKDQEHHIYVVGTSECEQSMQKAVMVSSNKSRWEQQVRDYLGEEYFLVGAHTLSAIHIMVFIHRYLWRYCWDIKTGHVATGIANVIGNKGGVQVGFNLGRTSLLFTNAHLAAHQNKMKERTANLTRIMKDSPLRRDKSGLGAHEDYDRVFFMGDLNPRLEATRDEVDGWLSAKPALLEKCLDRDQLLPLLNASAASAKSDDKDFGLWPLFSEASISFPPTYKFDPNSNVYDTSKKRRIPSWTDRILYKSDEAIRCLRYTSAPNYECSDHRPIFGQYEITVDLDDWEETVANQKTSSVCSIQ